MGVASPEQTAKSPTIAPAMALQVHHIAGAIMIGAFRFFKQSDGRGHFADMEVELTPATCAAVSSVTFGMPDKTQYPAEWLAASERGCRDALAALSAMTPPAEARFHPNSYCP